MKHILFATLVALSATASAADIDSIDTRHTHDLNPVVITGTGTYHRADNSPVAVKVISAKEIQDAHVSTLQDALSKLTTNVTTHTNGMGTFVNFNGVSDDYIVILENGKRVSGDDRWNRISLENVKRIEIYSGAASALYGSDAIAGVINIITDDTKSPVSVSSNTRLMNNGRLDEDVAVDVTAGKFSSRTEYTHHRAGNWQVNHYQEFEEGDNKVLKLTGRPMSAGYHSNNIAERLEWRFNDQWSVYLRGSYYDHLTDRPQAASYFTQKKTTDKKTKETTYTYSPKQAYTYDVHHTSYMYGGGARWTPNSRIHLYLDVYSDNFSSDYNYWQTDENHQRERQHRQSPHEHLQPLRAG